MEYIAGILAGVGLFFSGTVIGGRTSASSNISQAMVDGVKLLANLGLEATSLKQKIMATVAIDEIIRLGMTGWSIPAKFASRATAMDVLGGLATFNDQWRKLFRVATARFNSSLYFGIAVFVTIGVVFASIWLLPSWMQRAREQSRIEDPNSPPAPVPARPVINRRPVDPLKSAFGAVILLASAWGLNLTLSMAADQYFMKIHMHISNIRSDNMMNHLVPVGSIMPFTGSEQQLTAMAARGWAVCDGRDSADQGITDAIIDKTPNLTDGRFLQGVDIKSHNKMLPSQFPVLKLNGIQKNYPDYSSGEFKVPTDGTSTLKNGKHLFTGKWESPGQVVDFQWETKNGKIDVAPVSYSVVYIMLVK